MGWEMESHSSGSSLASQPAVYCSCTGTASCLRAPLTLSDSPRHGSLSLNATRSTFFALPMVHWWSQGEGWEVTLWSHSPFVTWRKTFPSLSLEPLQRGLLVSKALGSFLNQVRCVFSFVESGGWSLLLNHENVNDGIWKYLPGRRYSVKKVVINVGVHLLPKEDRGLSSFLAFPRPPG